MMSQQLPHPGCWRAATRAQLEAGAACCVSAVGADRLGGVLVPLVWVLLALPLSPAGSAHSLSPLQGNLQACRVLHVPTVGQWEAFCLFIFLLKENVRRDLPNMPTSRHLWQQRHMSPVGGDSLSLACPHEHKHARPGHTRS